MAGGRGRGGCLSTRLLATQADVYVWGGGGGGGGY